MHLKHHPDDHQGRRVLSWSVASIAELQEFQPDQAFVLFVAADTSGIDGPIIVRLAEDLIRAGATYACCWGPDCSRFHDAFDEADLAVNGESTDTRLLLTTWHDDEALEEAAWFALNSTFPAGEYFRRTKAVVVLTIGNQEWARRLDQYLDAGAPMRDEA